MPGCSGWVVSLCFITFIIMRFVFNCNVIEKLWGIVCMSVGRFFCVVLYFDFNIVCILGLLFSRSPSPIVDNNNSFLFSVFIVCLLMFRFISFGALFFGELWLLVWMVSLAAAAVCLYCGGHSISFVYCWSVVTALLDRVLVEVALF